VFGTETTMAEAARELESLAGCTHVLRAGDGTSQTALITADLTSDAADVALARVQQLGVPNEDIELLRLDSVGPTASSSPFASVVWADLVSQAGANARAVGRYLILMACAGIIAGLGVIYDNGILVVGAMAISPDLFPITATATALVLRRWRLAGRALLALAVGLGCAGLVAGVMTALLGAADFLPKGFSVGDSALLTGMSTVNAGTVLVAAAAGVAGMLALETRASSAVGVAISVTTIPASAYLGVAAGVGEADKVEGAILVLAVNVAMLVAGGALVLVIQRRLEARLGPSGLARPLPTAPQSRRDGR
jgi:uncharacterized hydrophobic protein (TIGR00271 family)